MADLENNNSAVAEQEDSTKDFDAVVKLDKLVETKRGDEEETVTLNLRAKLFRFEREAREWKERGTGELKLLKHNETSRIRLVMRRDKTHKVCANHLITSDMKLAPNVGSDRSWVYSVAADVSDGDASAETLAVRFGNVENAQAFKQAFEAAQASNASLAPASTSESTSAPVESTETKDAEPSSSTSTDAAAPVTEVKQDEATSETPASEVHGDTSKSVETPAVAQTDATADAVQNSSEETPAATTTTSTEAEEKKD